MSTETKEVLRNLYTITLTLLCIYLIIELKGTKNLLKEETEIKYEYSQIIDSLMTEIDSYQIEGIRHWNEELEKEYAPQYK